jgi:hypothetical protein
VLEVERWAELRREHFVRGVPIKELVRRTGLARNTVRVASRSSEPPMFQVPERPSKLSRSAGSRGWTVAVSVACAARCISLGPVGQWPRPQAAHCPRASDPRQNPRGPERPGCARWLAACHG